jgi:type 2 lantibiotic biosynthesis protein LanM
MHDAVTDELIDDDVDRLVATFLPEIDDDDRRNDIRDRLARAIPRSPELVVPDDESMQLNAPDGRDPLFITFAGDLASAWLPLGPAKDIPQALQPELLRVQTDLIATTLLRSLLEELHHHRDAGLLRGDDPEERFDDFVERTRTRSGLAALRTAHPGAFATARLRADRAAAVTMEVLDHIAADRALIAATIPGVSEDAPVERVGLGSGDPHRDGRSVALVRFADGGRVVHRPRDVRVDVAWNGFLQDLARLGVADLRTIATLDCGDHGYAEYVTADDEASPGPAYLDGVGQLTAVLHLLRGTDIHHENLLTSGGLPVVVDTETVLSPRPVAAPSYDDGAGSRIARDEVLESVLGIGILPNLVRAPGRDLALDVGAVGYAPGQVSPFRALGVASAGRDDMHTVLAQVPTTTPSANPVLAASDDARTARDRVAAAFRATAERVLENRTSVVEAVRSRFQDVVLRYVHAPTMFYAQLLRMATHPDLLDDRAARTTVLYRVSLREGGTGQSLADLELADLLAGDVPYFWCRADERAVHNDRGGSVDDFFVEPAVETAVRRIEEFSPAAVDRQLRLLDLAFVNRLDAGGEPTILARPRSDGPDSDAAGRPDSLHATADRVVVGIADAAVRDCRRSTDPAHPATWVGPQVTTSEQSQWLPGTLGYDLYGGSTGVALFLAGAAAGLGDERWAEVAEAVFRPVEAQLVEGRIDALDVSAGGMTGIGGTVWALMTSRHLLRAAGMLGGERADPERDRLLLGVLGDAARSDASPDFTSGLAGTLAAGLALEGAMGSTADPRPVDTIAAAMTEALRRRRDAGDAVYTGYAHGLAGIVPPLLRWADARGDAAAATTVTGLLDELIDARLDDGDWPRLVGGAADQRSYAWCHGAPGILLGLLDVRRQRPGTVPATVLADLASISRHKAIGHNPTLCHGDLGTLDVLAEAAAELGDEELARFVDDATARLVREQFASGTRRRDSKYDAADSLMVGSAGTGWSLLRHSRPGRFPSVLAFR